MCVCACACVCVCVCVCVCGMCVELREADTHMLRKFVRVFMWQSHKYQANKEISVI